MEDYYEIIRLEPETMPEGMGQCPKCVFPVNKRILSKCINKTDLLIDYFLKNLASRSNKITITRARTVYPIQEHELPPLSSKYSVD